MDAEQTKDQQPPGGAPGQVRPERPDRWLTGGVAGIAGASFLSDAGHEIPTSLMPSLLTSTLGAPAAVLGLIEGIADALAGAARLGVDYFSRRADPEAHTRRLAREIEKLGFDVTIQPHTAD